MDDKLALATENFGLQLAIGRMAVDIAGRLKYGEDVTQLRYDLDDAIQFRRLFLYEYNLGDSSLEVLEAANLAIGSLVEIYQLHGSHIVDEIDLTTLPSRTLVLSIAGGGGGDTGGGTTTPPSQTSAFYNIRLLPADFDSNWAYRNGWLGNSVYTLDIKGGATLRENIDYTLIPGGGFTLINGITLGSRDFIILSIVSAFSSPVTPPTGDSFPYSIPYLITT